MTHSNSNDWFCLIQGISVKVLLRYRVQKSRMGGCFHEAETSSNCSEPLISSSSEHLTSVPTAAGQNHTGWRSQPVHHWFGCWCVRCVMSHPNRKHQETEQHTFLTSISQVKHICVSMYFKCRFIYNWCKQAAFYWICGISPLWETAALTSTSIYYTTLKPFNLGIKMGSAGSSLLHRRSPQCMWEVAVQWSLQGHQR